MIERGLTVIRSPAWSGAAWRVWRGRRCRSRLPVGRGRVCGMVKSSGSHQALTRTRKSSSIIERAVGGPVGVVGSVQVERDGQRRSGPTSRRRSSRCRPG